MRTPLDSAVGDAVSECALMDVLYKDYLEHSLLNVRNLHSLRGEIFQLVDPLLSCLAVDLCSPRRVLVTAFRRRHVNRVQMNEW